MKKACLLLIVVLLPMVLDAQSFYRRRRDRSFIASVGTGTASYFGDLNNPGDIFDPKLNIEIGFEYKILPRISAGVLLTFFSLTGDDKEADNSWRLNKRNLSFRSSNLEVSAVGRIRLFEESGRYYQRPRINLHALGGIGVLWFNPKAQLPETDWNGNPIADAGKYVGLKQYLTEGQDYSKVAPVVLLGLGSEFMINPWFTVAVEGGYRLTFTDYLDDVSTNYPGIANFTDPIAAALSDRKHENDLPPSEPGEGRGNPDSDDGYFLWNVKVVYYLPSMFGVRTGAARRGSGRHR